MNVQKPTVKPFDISKKLIFEAYRKVKANKGAAGVDKQSIAEFEENLKDNLYMHHRSRMSHQGATSHRRSGRLKYQKKGKGPPHRLIAWRRRTFTTLKGVGNIMKTRVFLAFAVCFCSIALLQPAPAGATHNRAAKGIPEGAPAMTLLEPRSSTRVNAGDSIQVAYGFVNVFPHPSATLTYVNRRSGEMASIPLDVFAGTLTVPSDLPRGRYKLVKVTTFDTRGGIGNQYRNHKFTGVLEDGTVVSGRSKLRLNALDVKVI